MAVKVDDEDASNESIYIRLKGPSSKLIPWLRDWTKMSTDEYTDAEVIKMWEDTHEADAEVIKEGFSKPAPMRKLKMLSDKIKKIPDAKVPYILEVIAAFANFEEIKEIIENW